MKARRGEKRYSSTLCLTSALDWGVTVTSQLLYPWEEDKVLTLHEVAWAPRPVWMGTENFAPTRVSTPDYPAQSKSLPTTLSWSPSIRPQTANSVLLLLLQSALQPLVGFGPLYDFVPQSSIFTLLSPVSHFHLL